MIEISQIEYSFSSDDNYISNLGNLPPDEQYKIIDFMLTERIIGRVAFDFDKHQTIGFSGKMFDRYGQLIVDSRFILDGYHQFSPRQIITGNSLLPVMKHFDLYQDD